MTVEEAQNGIKQLKAQGYSEDEIIGSWYLMYVDGKLEFEQLEALCHVIGREITDEFKNMSDEERKSQGFEEIDEEEVDDAKNAEGKYSEDDNEEDEKEEDNNKDEEEKKKASNLFGVK